MKLEPHRTKVSAKGQVVIPKVLRERLGIEKGIEFSLTPIDENRILLEKVPKLSKLFGFMGRARGAAVLLEERTSEATRESERLSELFHS